MKRNFRLDALVLLVTLSFCSRQTTREQLPGLGASATHSRAKHSVDTIGVYNPSNSTFLLRTSNTSGFADITVRFGAPDDLPITGDWDGDGIDTVGIFRPSTSTFLLRNENESGAPDIVVPFGSPGDWPLAGDWNGDGKDSIGVYRPSNSTFYLRNLLAAGKPDRTIQFGRSGDLPIAGDWDGLGKDSIGFYRPADSTFHLRKSLDKADEEVFKLTGDSYAGFVPVAADWDGNGADTVGLFARGEFLIRYENKTGPPDVAIPYGLRSHKPLAGVWTSKAR